MKHLVATLAIAGTLAAALPARAQTPVPLAAPNEATLSVQGDGLVERAPDLARLSASIITNDDNSTVSSSKNNDVYNALIAQLRTAGVAADQVRTLSYNVVFVPHPPRGLPPEQQQPRYGYVTTRYLQITVSPVENLGKAIDAATTAGVTTTGGTSFDLKDRKSAYRSALALAMTDAKQTAETVASAGGFTMVRVKSVDVGYSAVPLRQIANVTARAAPAMAPPPTPTDIGTTGPITVTAHVTVVYVIR